MDKVKGLRESITLNKVAELGDLPVVRLSAEIFSDPSREIAYSVAVSDIDAYNKNLEHFRKEIDEFRDIVKQREDFILNLYHPIEEEIVIEEPIEGLPVEETPEEELGLPETPETPAP